MIASWTIILGAIGIVVLVVSVSVQLFRSAGAARDLVADAGKASTERRPPASSVRDLFDLGTSQRMYAFNADAANANDDAAQQLFDKLMSYYAANISQGEAIFWASLLSMIAGFAIIVVGIATAGTNTANAVIAGIAGLLSQFVSATFLVALRSTQQQSTAYAQNIADLRARDLRATADLRSVTLALHLIEQIADEGSSDLANQTRAAIATGLIIKQAPPAEAQTATRPPAANAPPPAPAASAPAPAPPNANDDTLRTVGSAESKPRIQSVTFDNVQPGSETPSP